MIKSMTGFSNKRLETENFVAIVEVKSLNSKFLDLSIRIPRSYSPHEQEIRNIASSILERGKVSMTVDLQLKSSSETRIKYKTDLFEKYYQELKELARLVGADENDLFKIALQSPEVIATEENTELDSFWGELLPLVEESLKECDTFRLTEGVNLQKQLEESIRVIEECKQKVVSLDSARMDRTRERIRHHLEEFIDREKIDQNRFEQELIYFIEKLDISEEMVRLESHLNYFMETLKDNNSAGKKLGFISQEIGREINTIGSKANDSGIQKLVVLMKDELEKIKEQVLNVL